MRSKGGAWNGKVLGASNGFPVSGAAAAAQLADKEQMASAATAPSKIVRFPSITFPTLFRRREHGVKSRPLPASVTKILPGAARLNFVQCSGSD
jgi:hypothetical protein